MDTVGFTDPLEFAGYPMTQAFATPVCVIPLPNTYTVGVDGPGLIDGNIGQSESAQFIAIPVTLALPTIPTSLAEHTCGGEEGGVFTVTW